MPTTILVTRLAPDRYRGFLASCMLEIAPGIYLSPDMSKGVRQRVWEVMMNWQEALPPEGGILMVWPDKHSASGLGISFIGFPKKEIIEHGEHWLVREPMTRAQVERLLRDAQSTQDDDTVDD